MRVDWQSWDDLYQDTGYDPCRLDRVTGTFLSGHPEAPAPDDSHRYVILVPPGTVGAFNMINSERHERALVHAIGDPALRQAAAEAWRRVQQVYADMPRTGSTERRAERKQRLGVLEELIARDPAVAERWSSDWHLTSALGSLWEWFQTQGLELGIRVENPPPWLGKAEQLQREHAAGWQAVVRERLDFIDGWLAREAPGCRAPLRPGATEEHLRAIETRLGEPLPDGLRTLWLWRDGADDRLAHFFDGHSLMPSESACTVRENLNDLLRDGHFDDCGPSWWSPAWLPILETIGGNHICVDLAAGQVVDFIHDDPGRLVLFGDVDALIERYADELAEGLWNACGSVLDPVDVEAAIIHRHSYALEDLHTTGCKAAQRCSGRGSSCPMVSAWARRV
jgi:cell wall assembly regulator SMI1